MPLELLRRRSARSWILALPGCLALLWAAAPDSGAGTQAVPVALRRLTDEVADPVHVTHASRSDPRLFIVEQEGRIRIYKDGALLPVPFLDIAGLVLAGGERGLLSVAFHPDYPARPYLYVYYTNRDEDTAERGDIVIARYSVSADPDLAEPASARVLLTVGHTDAGNHNGGQVAFGPDRKLYIGTGDGGGGCDDTGPGCNAQRSERLLGKMLRLDIEQNEDAPPYFGIPTDNPFQDAGHPLDKVWARGLRNPFRFGFDRQSGDLYIGDVGQSTREEVNRQPASSAGGENYGWPLVEGSLCNTCPDTVPDCPDPVPACDDPSLQGPLYEYSGSAVIAGFVYRGTQIPDLQGLFVFGDLNSGGLWAIDPLQPDPQRVELVKYTGGLSSLGEDAAGELYVCLLGSEPGDGHGVYRVLNPASLGSTPAAAALLALLAALAVLVGRRAARGR